MTGGGQHIGAKPDLTKLNFDGLPRGDNIESVGLLTPPRTLTLDEQFPSLEQNEEEEDENCSNSQPRIPNGYCILYV